MHHPRHKKRHTGKWLIALFLLGIIGGVVLAARGQKKEKPYEFITVEQSNITQAVSVTGRVVPEERVELGFEESGKVTRIWRKVGERALRGEVLAELDTAKITAELREAEAVVRAEEVGLEELRRGARPEDIRVKEAEEKKAEQEIVNTYGGALQALEDAYAKSDDAVRIKTASIFSKGQNNTYLFLIDTCDSGTKNDIENSRGVSENVLKDWRKTLNGMDTTTPREIFDAEFTKTKIRLEAFRKFLEKISETVNARCVLGDASLETHRKNISAGRENVLSAGESVEALEQNIATARRALETKERELELKRAGSSAEEIRAQEIRVDEAEARASFLSARKQSMILRAPFDGIVTEEKIKPGEIIGGGTPLIVFISKGSPRVEAYVPESDIAKIRPGNEADIALDAYEAEDMFPAQVVAIDPAETMIDGVATYKVTLRFTREDARVKPGMTADIDIITAIKNQAIAIPQRAVIQEDGKKYVRVMKGDGTIERVRVETGIRGSDGTIEITEGVAEGDKVILFIDGEAAHRN